MGSGHYADDLVERANRVIGETAEHTKELAAERSANPDDRLLSQLVRVRAQYPDRLTESELASMMMFIVTAGFETTMYTACNMVYHLLKNPEQMELVRNDRLLMRGTVEEVSFASSRASTSPPPATRTRIWRSPDSRSGVARSASSPTTRPTMTLLRSRTRTSSTSRARRTGRSHSGADATPARGRNLARLELVMTLEATLDRFPNLEMVAEDVEWTTSHVLRGPKAFESRW
jgi:hypothetical protein